MIKINDAILNSIICHKACNDESKIVTSNSLILLESNEQEKTICNILLKPFVNISVIYEFYHTINIDLNVINRIANDIIDGGDFVSKSKDILNHLFTSSRYPNIKDGDLIIASFEDIVVDNKYCDALYICKIENKDSFIETDFHNAKSTLNVKSGVSSNKIDKACLIVFDNRVPSVFVIDKNNSETQYWFDDFLGVCQRKDEYYNTQNVISMAKNFVTKELPKEFEVSKADQAELANKTLKFFKEKDTFDMDEFANEVMAQPDVIDSFNRYKENYQQERDIEIADSFTISDSAVKKQSRVLKSVIKLDKNFHIYVHGNNQYIKKGYDEETGMHFYQLFFKEEL